MFISNFLQKMTEAFIQTFFCLFILKKAESTCFIHKYNKTIEEV